MPLLYQKHIFRRHLQANPQVLFVFGDNVRRYGHRGQAAAMRGEPNAMGIATKWAPSMRPADFFHDRDIAQIEPILTKDLEPVRTALIADRIVVWPKDGIGTGLSQLPALAPQIWGLLESTRLMFETL